MPFHRDPLVDEAMRRNIGAGFHYFDPDTMRGFGSKAHEGYRLTKPNATTTADDDILVIMSNRDTHFGSVVRGQRHYYLIVVKADGKTDDPEEYGADRYSVADEKGYWLTLRSAQRKARAIAQDVALKYMGCKP